MGKFTERLCGSRLAFLLVSLLLTSTLLPSYEAFSRESQARAAVRNIGADHSLTPGQSIQGELTSNQQASYSLNLTASDFLRVDVYAVGADLTISLLVPGQQRIFQ